MVDIFKVRKEVAARVALAIFKSGIKKNALAERSGIPVTSLHRKMNGDSPFTLEELFKLASLLNVSLASLIPASDEVETTRQREMKEAS